MKKIWVVLLVLAVAATLLLAACGGTEEETTTTIAPEPATAQGEPITSGDHRGLSAGYGQPVDARDQEDLRRGLQ